MSVVIFIGPTLSVQDAARELNAVYLSPVAEGEFYRAAVFHPSVIGIVDGYSDNVPGVVHKEILAAMAEGIHVFGAAGIGALRAAELHTFGMEGVGRVFESFRDGTLEDDDEVAVLHGPAETGCEPRSEPMVNVRATIERAQADGLLTAQSAAALIKLAKTMFYKERTYPAILAAAARSELPTAVVDLMRAWIPDHRVDQKREDALQMLRAIRRLLQEGLPPKAIDYYFERTLAWAQTQKDAQVAAGTESTMAARLR